MSFNDKFSLTQAVLDGRKTQTRGIVNERLWDGWTVEVIKHIFSFL